MGKARTSPTEQPPSTAKEGVARLLSYAKLQRDAWLCASIEICDATRELPGRYDPTALAAAHLRLAADAIACHHPEGRDELVRAALSFFLLEYGKSAASRIADHEPPVDPENPWPDPGWVRVGADD